LNGLGLRTIEVPARQQHRNLEEKMEWVSIQEASRRLNVSQDVVRRYAREGRLVAKREPNANGGTSWVVELPEGNWQDDFKHNIHKLAQQLTPWWWPNEGRVGQVHYLESLGIEEVEPLFLCGLTSEDIWPAVGHDMSQRCPECLEEVAKKGLPMETRE
jgi:hypothetical protein